MRRGELLQSGWLVALVGLVILALPVLAAAARAQPIADAVLVDRFESHQPDVAVGGHVIVGVMAIAAVRALAEDKLVVPPLGEKVSNEVCLRVSSRDGTYTYRSRFRIEDSAGGVRFPYRSDYPAVVRSFAGDDVGIAVATGSCDASSSTYLPVTSSDAPGRPERLVVYVNSFGATDVFYQVGRRQLWSDPAPCREITEGRRTTFDFVCELESSVSSKAMDVKILRERFGREQPEVELRVLGIR